MQTSSSFGQITEADFKALARVDLPNCLSFFVDASQHTEKTLKALLQNAHQFLGAKGLGSAEVEDVLSPIEVLLLQRNLPATPGHTLAVFRSNGEHHAFAIPYAIKPRLVVGQRFFLKPILPCLTRAFRYWVLALSENCVHLFRCENEHCSLAEVPGLPTSMKEVLAGRDFSPSLQAHASAAGGGGREGLTFHSHSAPIEESHTNRRVFCRAVAGAVETRLAMSNEPLILGCVKEFVPMYQAVNGYRRLMPDAILGNPDHLSPSEMCAAAEKIVQTESLQRARSALSDFLKLEGTQHASSLPSQILREVFRGRVKEVLVADDVDVWGTYDRSKDRLEFSPEGPDADDQEITNLAAIEAVLHGGNAYSIPVEDMPGLKPMAAVFRY